MYFLPTRNEIKGPPLSFTKYYYENNLQSLWSELAWKNKRRLQMLQKLRKNLECNDQWHFDKTTYDEKRNITGDKKKTPSMGHRIAR